LEPQAPYEVTQGGGGVEDPRVVYVPLLKRFVMTYTAVVPNQAQIAVAVSDDLQTWTRLGVLVYARPARTWAEELTANKDGAFFPEPILDPHGVPSFAIIHRPTMRVHVQFGARQFIRPSPGLLAHEGVWISYVPDSTSQRGLTAFGVAMSNLSGDVIESSYEELGLVQTGTFAGRDLDTLGFAVNDQHFADTALDAIRAARVSAGGTPGIATHETMMELNYGVHVSSSVTIAPNLQYIVHPDQFAEPFFTGTIRNAFVIGLHVSVNLAPLLTAHR
jgi:hypothetical protein